MSNLGIGIEQDPQSKHYFITYEGQRIHTSRGYEQYELDDYTESELFGRVVSSLCHTPSMSPILMLRIGRALTFEQIGCLIDNWFTFWGTREISCLFSKKHKIPTIFLCPECCEEPLASSWFSLLRDLKAIGYQLADREAPTTYGFANMCGTNEALVVCDCCLELFKSSTHLYVEQQRV